MAPPRLPQSAASLCFAQPWPSIECRLAYPGRAPGFIFQAGCSGGTRKSPGNEICNDRSGNPYRRAVSRGRTGWQTSTGFVTPWSRLPRRLAPVREVAFHRFSPQRVSGRVIAESHPSIHTWPEPICSHRCHTCGLHTNPEGLPLSGRVPESRQMTDDLRGACPSGRRHVLREQESPPLADWSRRP